MDVSLVLVSKSKRYIIENLFQYYMHDMSEYADLDMLPNGVYNYSASLIDEYWLDGRYPYLVYCGRRLAGFALIRRYPNDLSRYDVGQFFILRFFRRKSVGFKVFTRLTELHPGEWLTRVMLENHSALSFWQSVISRLVDGSYKQTIEQDSGLPMTFIRYNIEPKM